MKHITLLIAFALATVNVVTAQNISSSSTLPNLIAQAHYTGLDTTIFLPSDSLTYTYTGSNGGDLTHTLKFSKEHKYLYQGGGVYDSLQFIAYQTFDAHDNIDSQITQTWYNNRYTNYINYIYAYNANNLDTVEITQGWDSVSETGYAWLNIYKTVFNLDANGNDTFTHTWVWNAADTLWVPQSFIRYIYDLHNNLIQEIRASWPGTAWDTTANVKNNYYYNNTGLDTLAINIEFNFNTYKWDTIHKTRNLYRANTAYDSVQIIQAYNSGQVPLWSNLTNIIYSYDGNNNVTFITTQNWSLNNSTWVNYSQEQFNYNTYNQALYDIVNYWSTNEWIPTYDGNADFYYYSNPTGINRLAATGEALTVYPNPADKWIHIAAALSQPGRLQLSLVNMLGQTVWSANEGNVSQFNGNVPVTGLPGGVYLPQMRTGQQVQSTEIIVAK